MGRTYLISESDLTFAVRYLENCEGIGIWTRERSKKEIAGKLTHFMVGDFFMIQEGVYVTLRRYGRPEQNTMEIIILLRPIYLLDREAEAMTAISPIMVGRNVIGHE